VKKSAIGAVILKIKVKVTEMDVGLCLATAITVSTSFRLQNRATLLERAVNSYVYIFA
jgi:hypothetical protein